MTTLYDLGVEVTKIREAINLLEVKGESNASLIVYAHKKCNEIIEAINSLVAQNGIKREQEEGVTDGESD